MFTEDLLLVVSLLFYYELSYLILTILWTKEYGYLHFPDEEAEASNIKVIKPKANLLIHWN